jgi:membrane protein DedA with SNARE-associated domain
MDTKSVIDSLLIHHELAAGLILFGSSIIEYIFPPFPGDTVTLAGAILVGLYGWNFILVFSLVTIGSVLGSVIDYYIGHWFYLRNPEWFSGKRSKVSEGISIVLEKFQKHGEIYIVLNRFLPGIRAFFFIAAGMTRLSLLKVSFYSLISASLWNLMIMTAGYFVGANFEILESVISRYNLIIIVIILIVAVLFIRKLMRIIRK